MACSTDMRREGFGTSRDTRSALAPCGTVEGKSHAGGTGGDVGAGILTDAPPIRCCCCCFRGEVENCDVDDDGSGSIAGDDDGVSNVLPTPEGLEVRAREEEEDEGGEEEGRDGFAPMACFSAHFLNLLYLRKAVGEKRQEGGRTGEARR